MRVRTGVIALYRKYRSRNFDEVIGQEHVTRTLSRALAHDRISHAYLFTGPRGVGKTSIARILARSLNCTGASRPCEKCANCRLPIGSHLDLLEIDAASNRSIDEIRDLRDKISSAPSLGRYKIFIIDEVHMLTKEAFNALLKTLEEPPSHAILILATTEAHKLPETIISRTQRFTFKPLSAPAIEAGLMAIAKAEKLTLSPEAAGLLALAADGSYRDAISLLDQAANLEADRIEAAGVRSLLGWADSADITKLGLAIAGGNPNAALAALNDLTVAGAPPAQVIRQLSLWWRQLMLAAAGARPADQFQQKIIEMRSLPEIITGLQTIVEANASAWPEIALEAAAVKLSAAVTPITATADPLPPTPKAAPARSEAAADSELVLGERWQKALLLIKQHNNSLYSLLRSCQIKLDDQRLIIGCRFSFWRDRLREAKNLTLMEQTLKRAYGQPLTIEIQLVGEPGPAKDPEAELVSSALKILGGEVVDG